MTTVTLAEVGAQGLFSDGDWVESKDQDAQGSVRLTQLADVGVGTFRDRSDRWMREDQATRLNCTFLAPDDVLIARMPDPIGRACLVPHDIGRAVTAVDVAILRVDRDFFEPAYVSWMINAPQFHMRVEALQSGTTRKRISRKNLATLSIPRAPLREQRRIVEILEEHLSHLDAGDGILATANARSRRLHTSVLWYRTHDIPGARPHRLDSFAEVRLGRQLSPKNHTGERMRPYLRAANVGWDRLLLDDVKEMQFTESEERTHRLEPGDILLTEASGSPAEVGKSAIYQGQLPAVCIQNTLLRVRVHDANPAFVQKFLLAEAMNGRFVPEARGVGINHLGRARLAALTVTLPSAEEQESAVRACGEIIEDLSALQQTLDLSMKRSSILRRALLAAAFEGKLTGRHTDREVVEERAAGDDT